MPSRTFESFIEASGAWNEAQRLAVASQRLDDEQYDDEHAARTRTLAATLTARLAAAEPNLMTDGHLAALESTTAKLVKAVEEYIEPPVTADASEQAISTQLDELVGLVATLPTPEVTDPDAAAITLRNHVAKSAADLDALKAEIDAARSEAVALVSSLETGDVATLNGTLTSLEAQAATLDEQMQAAIAKAAANADTARATMRADFDGTIAGFETAHQESTSGFEERASDLVSRIHQQEKRVTDIVNTIGGKAITGGFGEWEASERKSADQLRLFASGTAAVAIVFLVVAASFDWFESDSNNWQGMVGRLGFSALMFALAGYLSREASQHRANANYARRLAIELTSIGPFVHDNLDEAEGLKMLAEFTKNVFGRAEPPSVKKANGLRPGRSTAALKDDA